MRIVIAAIGRLKDGGERELLDRYVGRIDSNARVSAIGPVTIHEFPESRSSDAASRKADEASRLLRIAGDADGLIALDEHGRATSSADFARLIGNHRDEGTKSLAFLIGGPDGHGDPVLAAAKLKLSLSAMTLPHGLARVVLAEQIYRTVTILTGHPYHRT